MSRPLPGRAARHRPGRIGRRQLPQQALRAARPDRLRTRNRLRSARLKSVRAGHVQIHRRLAAHLRPGPKPAPVHHRRPPTAVSRGAARGGARLAGAAGVRAVRGGVPDQVRLRDHTAPPQRAEDTAHDRGRLLVFIILALQTWTLLSKGAPSSVPTAPLSPFYRYPCYIPSGLSGWVDSYPALWFTNRPACASGDRW